MSDDDEPRLHWREGLRLASRGASLVWRTDARLCVALVLLTAWAGVAPAGAVYVSRWIVDSVVTAMATHEAADRATALRFIGVEAALVASVLLTQRALALAKSLLFARLGYRVSLLLLDKSVALDLEQHEDAELQQTMTMARRDATSRPFSLAQRALTIGERALALVSVAGVLVSFSPLAVLVLLAAGLPGFFAETGFSGKAYRFHRGRTPELRDRAYVESLLTGESFAREVLLFGLAEPFIARFRTIFDDLWSRDRSLQMRRALWTSVFALVGLASFYGAYVWVVAVAIGGALTLGQMTMYAGMFRQGQKAIAALLTASSGVVEDVLYLRHVFGFLDTPAGTATGTAVEGPAPGTGVTFDAVTYAYPGSTRPAVAELTFALRPGQTLAFVGANGSGKSTMVKLLLGLYRPTSGTVSLDGLPYPAWDPEALRARFSVIFQDFVRYKLTVGENVDAGDGTAPSDLRRRQRAADAAGADAFVAELAAGWDAKLGRHHLDGTELSGGQWQRLALARAFYREQADVLVLDEPTASMDAAAEARVYARVMEGRRDRMTVLISHRLSTIRNADRIVVLHEGRQVEAGAHDELLDADRVYAHMFSLQAAGYAPVLDPESDAAWASATTRPDSPSTPTAP